LPRKKSHLETVGPSDQHVLKRALDVMLDYRKERDIEMKPYFETTWMLYLYLEKIINTINRGYLISSNDKNMIQE